MRAWDVAARQRDAPPVVVLPHEVLARRQEVPVRLHSMCIQVESHTTYEFKGFRKSTLSKNRQLIV